MKNLKEAKELLEQYKNITLEQLEIKYKTLEAGGIFKIHGSEVLNGITGFGKYTSCKLCIASDYTCSKCIYSFRLDGRDDKSVPCIDLIYRELRNAKNAEQLFAAIQKRISYLSHIIEWVQSNKH